MLALHPLALRFIALLGAAAACLTDVQAVDLIRIAGDGSGDYARVDEAIAAAADGDTLFVTSAPLDTELILVGKGVTFIVDVSSSWFPQRLQVEGLPAGSTAVIRGFPSWWGSTTDLLDCMGSIVIADSRVNSVSIVRCASVSLSHCLCTGDRTPTTSLLAPRAPVVIEDSSVLMTSCETWGYEGKAGQCGFGFCSECCFDGEPGGSALTTTTLSQVRLQSCILHGGLGGHSACDNCSNGPDGPALWTEPTSELAIVDTQLLSNTGYIGSPTILNDVPRSVEQPASVQGGSAFQLRIHGVSGDTAFLLGGGLFAHLPQTVDSGILQVDQTLGRRRLGALPPSGELLLTFTAPPMLPGQLRSLPLQAVLLQPNGAIRFAPADIITFRGTDIPAW